MRLCNCRIYISLPFLILNFIGEFSNALGTIQIRLENKSFLHKTLEGIAQNEILTLGSYQDDYDLDSMMIRFQPGFRASSATDSSDSTVYFDPKELWIGKDTNTYYLHAGYISPNWEGTDIINPMDIARMHDNSDPLNSYALSSAGLHFGYVKSLYGIEFIYVPTQVSSKGFGKLSPWLPRKLNLPLGTEDIEIKIPDKVEYEILPREELNQAKLNNWGSRLQLHFGSIDAALAYFEGLVQSTYYVPVVDVAPILQTSSKTVYQLQTPIRLLPVEYRRRTTAGFLSWNHESYIWKLAYRQDQPVGSDLKIPARTDLGVLGLEKQIFLSDSSLILILQYITSRQYENASLMSVQSLYEQATLTGLRWNFLEKNTLTLGAFKSLKDSSYIAQADLEHTYNDHFTFAFGCQILGGPNDRILGILDDRDRLNLKFTGTF